MGQISAVMRLALIWGILLYGIYGIVILIIPVQYVALTGGAAFDAGWIRWSGGLLLAVGYGQFRVLNAPAKQGTLVITVNIASLLIAIALIFSFVTQEIHVFLFWIVFPIVLTVVHTVLMFLGYQSSQRVL